MTCSIPSFSVEAYHDTLFAGKYLVRKGEPISVMLGKAHLDPVVYGDDVGDFKPERMLDENFARINKEFSNSWKPFGNGKRACIGRDFAWQEAVLIMAMLFQDFDFSLDDPSYRIEIQETLTIKPKDFYMRASLRHGMSATELEQQLASKGAADVRHRHASAQAVTDTSSARGKPLAIFYGSKTDTCETMAQRVAADASRHGFRATIVAPLDVAKQDMPKDRPVVIVTATYEGQPPSNAASFVTWMESLKEGEMDGFWYAVFGCGHHDWVQTFHRIPNLVDSTLHRLGGSRLAPLATADAGEGDMFSDFEAWEDGSLWPALQDKYDMEASADSANDGANVEVSVPRKMILWQDVEEAVVVSARTLTAAGSTKNHIEIQMPTGTTYRAGDYLAVLPFNPKQTVSRVLRRFGLSWDATLKISTDLPTTLPTDQAVTASDVLGAYVELGRTATKKVSRACGA